MARALEAGAIAALVGALAGCSTLDLSQPSGPPPANPAFHVLAPDPLIGEWGVASFRDANAPRIQWLRGVIERSLRAARSDIFGDGARTEDI